MTAQITPSLTIEGRTLHLRGSPDNDPWWMQWLFWLAMAAVVGSTFGTVGTVLAVLAAAGFLCLFERNDVAVSTHFLLDRRRIALSHTTGWRRTAEELAFEDVLLVEAVPDALNLRLRDGKTLLLSRFGKKGMPLAELAARICSETGLKSASEVTSADALTAPITVSAPDVALYVELPYAVLNTRWSRWRGSSRRRTTFDGERRIVRIEDLTPSRANLPPVEIAFPSIRCFSIDATHDSESGSHFRLWLVERGARRIDLGGPCAAELADIDLIMRLVCSLTCVPRQDSASTVEGPR